MGFSYGQPDTVNPGRFRRQKEKVHTYMTVVRKQRAKVAEEHAQREDHWRHDYSDRVRIIRQMKNVLGFPLIAHEGWEYRSKIFPVRMFQDKMVERAMRYFDPAITAEQFDQLMASMPAYWQVENWLLCRYTLIETIEYEGKWFEIPTRTNTKFPQTELHVYWLDPAKVDCSGDSWKVWKVSREENLSIERPTPVETRDECSNPAPTTPIWTEDMSCGASVAQPAKKVGWCKQLYLKAHEALTGE